MANSKQFSNNVMPLSGENKEEITLCMLLDTNSRESKVWSVIGEDGINFATAANSKTQVVSKGDDDVVDNFAMSKTDHGHVEDRTKCLMNAATMSNIDAQDIDQSDLKTEELSNALTAGQEQDTENSMTSGTHLREHVFTSNRKEKVGSCIRPISNRNYLRRNRDIDTGAILSTNSQRNVSPIYYGRGKLEGSMADILKPMKKERKTFQRYLRPNSKYL